MTYGTLQNDKSQRQALEALLAGTAPAMALKQDATLTANALGLGSVGRGVAEELKDLGVPVTRFGAIAGGSSAVNRAAFQAAANAGVPIAIPAGGDYTLDAPISVQYSGTAFYGHQNARGIIRGVDISNFFNITADIEDVQWRWLQFRTAVDGAGAGYQPACISGEHHNLKRVRIRDCEFRLAQGVTGAYTTAARALAFQLVLNGSYGNADTAMLMQDIEFSGNVCIGGGNGFIALLNHIEFVRTGTVQSGSGTTIRLDSGASATNDVYNGFLISIDTGTGSIQTREILDYDGATKDCVIEETLDVPLDASSTYILADPRPRLMNAKINNNLFLDAGQNPTALGYETTISLSGFAEGMEVLCNTLDNPKYGGIEVVRGQRSVIGYNTFRNVSRETRYLYSSDASFGAWHEDNHWIGNRVLGAGVGFCQLFNQRRAVIEANYINGLGGTSTSPPMTARAWQRCRVRDNAFISGASQAVAFYLESGVGKYSWHNKLRDNYFDNRRAAAPTQAVEFNGANTKCNELVGGTILRAAGFDVAQNNGASRNFVRGYSVSIASALLGYMESVVDQAVADSGTATTVSIQAAASGCIRFTGGSLTAGRTVHMPILLGEFILINTYSQSLTIDFGGSTFSLAAGATKKYRIAAASLAAIDVTDA